MNREYIIEHFEDAKILNPEKIQSYPFHRNNVEKSWEYKVGIGVGCFGNFKYEYLISVQDDEKIALKCRKDSSKWMSYKEFMENIKITQHMKTTFQHKIFETIVWMINEKMIIFPRIQMINDKINYYIGTNDSGYDKSNDLIKRAIAIKRAITNSNAEKHLKGEYEEYTVAEAIYMKQHGIALKETLLQEMKDQYAKACNKINKENGDKLAETAEKYVTGMFCSKEGKTNTDEYEKARKAYIDSHTYEMVDPIHIKDKIDELEDEISKFKAGIDAALSVSNATTDITIEY